MHLSLDSQYIVEEKHAWKNVLHIVSVCVSHWFVSIIIPKNRCSVTSYILLPVVIDPAITGNSRCFFLVVIVRELK